MIVNKQKPIEFVNTCGAILRTLELESAILWWTKKPVARLKKVFMSGEYPAVAIHKEKIHVHRLLMSFWEGRHLNRWEYVHHINGNKLDARKENLQLISESEHQSHHNKGKVVSDLTRKKISQANQKRKGMKMKKRRNIPLDELAIALDMGESINSIARYYGVDWSTIKSRIYENPELIK